MPRLRSRPAFALLGALLCLAACVPKASGPTATPTVMPTRVPAGWKVLATPYFPPRLPAGLDDRVYV